MKMPHQIKLLSILVAFTFVSPGATADKDDDDDDMPSFGLAGLLSKKNRAELPKLTLASGKALASAPIKLRSGGYYVLPIESDGSQELALEGPGFFRAIWVNEVVINDLEIRPYGLESLEFDDGGLIEIKFVAIKPGSYYLKVPGSRGENLRVLITIK